MRLALRAYISPAPWRCELRRYAEVGQCVLLVRCLPHSSKLFSVFCLFFVISTKIIKYLLVSEAFSYFFKLIVEGGRHILYLKWHLPFDVDIFRVLITMPSGSK